MVIDLSKLEQKRAEEGGEVRVWGHFFLLGNDAFLQQFL